MKTLLTIAGSDCSGGAGIQADLKTFTAHKKYGMSVITALTAQNTTGVYGIQEATPAFVAQQLDCVFTDIVPDAIKIGMVSNSQIIQVIAEKLLQYQGKNIVLDPVMIATSGGKLLIDGAMAVLINNLIPLAQIITPNIPEAEALCQMTIDDTETMAQAAEQMAKRFGTAVLIKGGHLPHSADDVLWWEGEAAWFKADKIETVNTHGTGCTLSSAIACYLADGYNMVDSVAQAKKYITGALGARLDLGQGNGPLNHCYQMK